VVQDSATRFSFFSGKCDLHVPEVKVK